MDAETLEALRGSIAKWQAIVDGTGEDEGPNNCPLCQKFHFRVNEAAKPQCEGCPVARATGMPVCRGSPYEDYEDADIVMDEEAMTEAAKMELDFLKSLLLGVPA